MVQGRGKFEELLVCSHEIAASTAQLVAASKVRSYRTPQDAIKPGKVSPWTMELTPGTGNLSMSQVNWGPNSAAWGSHTTLF